MAAGAAVLSRSAGGETAACDDGVINTMTAAHDHQAGQTNKAGGAATLCGRLHDGGSRRCWSCASQARLIHLLALSGHEEQTIARRLALSVEQVRGAVAAVQHAEPVDELTSEIIGRWGPLPFDLTSRTVANLRALTHVPCRLVCEQVDAAIARSHAPYRAIGVRPPAGAEGLLTHARIATRSGIDERHLKRLLGVIPEPGKRRAATRPGGPTAPADRGRGDTSAGGRIAQAIALPTAWRICRAVDIAPSDIPGL